jgi:hypothetical protein
MRLYHVIRQNTAWPIAPSIRPFVLFPSYKQKRNNNMPIKGKNTYVVSP